MTKLKEIYKCEICGNIVEVLHIGQGELVCCGQPMNLMEEKKEEMGIEKHLPMIEKGEGAVLVKVGDLPHPMESNHFIEWIEAIFESGKSCRVFLEVTLSKPEVIFKTDEEIKEVRAYCNVHGLWVHKFI